MSREDHLAGEVFLAGGVLRALQDLVDDFLRNGDHSIQIGEDEVADVDGGFADFHRHMVVDEFPAALDVLRRGVAAENRELALVQDVVDIPAAAVDDDALAAGDLGGMAGKLAKVRVLIVIRLGDEHIAGTDRLEHFHPWQQQLVHVRLQRGSAERGHGAAGEAHAGPERDDAMRQHAVAHAHAIEHVIDGTGVETAEAVDEVLEFGIGAGGGDDGFVRHDRK